VSASPTVVAVVAALNEADTVADTVRALASLSGVSRVVVVDDGSRDGTAEAATSAGAVVVDGPATGKGAALEIGAAAAEDADILLLADADLGASASAAGALLAPVLAGEADMTVGVFPRPAGKAGFGLVKRLSRWGIARYGDPGFSAEAPLSGQRALNAAALRAARPFAGGFGTETATTIRVLRAGLRVVEVPVEMSHRATGRDLAGFAHRGRQLAQVAGALLALASEPHEES
jgi:glycosyltransferase involved in cell wall biosynthesis